MLFDFNIEDTLIPFLMQTRDNLPANIGALGRELGRECVLYVKEQINSAVGEWSSGDTASNFGFYTDEPGRTNNNIVEDYPPSEPIWMEEYDSDTYMLEVGIDSMYAEYWEYGFAGFDYIQGSEMTLYPWGPRSVVVFSPYFVMPSREGSYVITDAFNSWSNDALSGAATEKFDFALETGTIMESVLPSTTGETKYKGASKKINYTGAKRRKKH